ncbi:MAG: hypothetical protein DRI44_00255 [Chlamydiae bacterium]|nr:MAG: hypothetical protein DRI44_00255 [Chlamydiota bacterium]
MKLSIIIFCTVFVLTANFLFAVKTNKPATPLKQKSIEKIVPKKITTPKTDSKTAQNTVPSVTKRVKYNIAVLPKNWFEILLKSGTSPVVSNLTFNFDTPQEDFFDDLVCAVDDTEKVNVIERAKLRSILNERSLQDNGIVASDVKNQDKPILGIHYYLTASWNKSGDNFIVRVRLFDIRTGEVITGRARKADRYETIEAAISKVLNRLGDNAWYARIIRIEAYKPGKDVLRSGAAQGGFISDSSQNKEEYEQEMLTGKKRTKTVIKVYLSAGQKEGVLKNDRFFVVRDMGANASARDLIDPETGRSLGHAELKIGLLRVTEVYPGYSIAMIESETKRIQRGDRIIPFTGTFIPKDFIE